MDTVLDKRQLENLWQRERALEGVEMRLSLVDSLRGRSVFLTGHTGFKGSWLALWLQRLGACVTGYSLARPSEPNIFVSSQIGEIMMRSYDADVRDFAALRAALHGSRPDVVIHLAAHPEAIFCCTEINFIDADGRPHADWANKQYSNIETLDKTPPQRIHELISRMGWFATCGLMRLEDAKKLSLGLGVYGFDVVLIAELLLLGDFVKVREPLFSYRMAKSKNAEDYQIAFNSDSNPLPAPKRPYVDLAARLLGTVYRSQLPSEQKLEIFADFVVTLSRTNKWRREEITSELIGRGTSLRDSEFAMLLAVVLSRSVPCDTIKDNALIRAMYLPATEGKYLPQIAETVCARAYLCRSIAFAKERSRLFASDDSKRRPHFLRKRSGSRKPAKCGATGQRCG